MSNVLSEEKKQQVIALGKLGWSLRRIEQATGVRRETASAYLKTTGVEVYLPGWGRRAPAKPAIQPTPDPGAKPAIQVTPDFFAPFSRKPPVPSTCEVYRERIEQGLAHGRNGKAIWQDLVSESGYTGSYQAVKRFVQKLRGPRRREAAGIILTAPGEEAQVDYGSGPMVRDTQSGKYRRTRLFVLTLGYSRKSVRLLTWRSSVRTWAELHEKAFRRLGGCTKVVVLDNLKEGVAVPDLYDPTINPLFRDVLAHYGVVALPCRIQDPDRKGKVYTKRTAGLAEPREVSTGLVTGKRMIGRAALISKMAEEVEIHRLEAASTYQRSLELQPGQFLAQVFQRSRVLIRRWQSFTHLPFRMGQYPLLYSSVRSCPDMNAGYLTWHNAGQRT